MAPLLLGHLLTFEDKIGGLADHQFYLLQWR